MLTKKNRPALTLLISLVLAMTAGDRLAAAVPAAPTPIAPADGASVQVPFAISWSAVSDPDGVVAYNWQVSATSTFASIVTQDSTNGDTQGTVSGLPNGTYFWRVQAVNGAFVQGAWSQPRSVTVTGVGPGEPGTPTLAPTKAYSTFHPYETITFNWTAVPGAATYTLEAATDPSFPIVTRIHINNIPSNTMTFAIANPEGSYFARVYAVNANGIGGVPSNVIQFSVFFNNPIGPPPVLASPATGSTLTLPITLTWADVPNPQPSGYELQIARDSSFSSVEEDDPQLTDPSRTVLSLTSGTKFWRVRSAQGDNSPDTAAETAWSATRSFTIPAAPSKPVSVVIAKDPLYSGESTLFQLQLSTAVPSGGATIALSSSDQGALPVPATVTMPGNLAWMQFDMIEFGQKAGQVNADTPVTVTATINSASAAGHFTVKPPSLHSLIISPSTISGGAQPGGIVQLNGQAPSGGAVVTLSSDSPAVQPPATVTVDPGVESVSFAVPTRSVTANTTATVTASWNGVSTQTQVTLTPQQPPASITLDPTTTVGLGGSSFATVRIATANTTDETMQITSSNPSVASVNNSVQIPSGTTAGGFNIFTSPVATPTAVTISVTGGGVTKSATLTVTPDASSTATLQGLTVSPSSVTGGGTSQGTVTLSAAAPSGGAVVGLSSSNQPVAGVPATVTVPSGATGATFTVSTSAVSTSTSATISAAYGGVTRTATQTVTAAGQTGTATLTVTATGRSGTRITSSPTGINVSVGSTGSASFATGTSVRLSTSSGRSAVWSGACSSGGNKRSSCTFTFTGTSSVNASVQ
jgi:hypothetical protein